ncbi:hypothetical protein FHS85_004447 [Rhodoligotrophos appendicifer]
MHRVSRFPQDTQVVSKNRKISQQRYDSNDDHHDLKDLTNSPIHW